MKETNLFKNRGVIEFACARNFIYLFVFLFFLYFYGISCEKTDFRLHVQIVEKLEQGRLVAPHFLYHLVIWGLSRAFHISFNYAACLTLASCVVFSMILIERILGCYLKGRYSDYFLLFVSMALMLVSAIYFPLINKNPYMGIWSPNPWHNPTFVAAKPFVLLAFYLYTLEITAEKGFQRRFSLIRISIILAIGALVKPNFILAFITGSILFCFFRPGRKIPMLVKTVQLLLPVLGVLIFQFLFTYYYEAAGSSSIQFCFFNVWKAYAKSIPLAMVQGAAFPMVVLMVMLSRLSKDKALLFSWVLFVVGLLIFGLLTETGYREYHGNFGWTYMSCLSILFIYSAVSFLRWASEAPNMGGTFQIKFFLCSLVFLFHLFSGLYYIGYMAG